MALPTIDQSFIAEFETGVKLAYQRMGSYLRPTARVRTGVKNKTRFQLMGKGSATQKARNGDIPAMNIVHSYVDVTLADWYAGEWIDELDLLRTNNEEMTLATESGARALGRKTDDMINAALTTTTNTANETTNGATLAWALGLVKVFGDADIPEGSDRFVVISYANWVQLMALDSFNRAEYVGNTDVLTQGAVAKRWLGFNWMPFSGLTTDGSNFMGFAYHKPCIGVAIGADVTSSMQYYNTKASTFVSNMMQMEAVLIDVTGIYKCNLKK